MSFTVKYQGIAPGMNHDAALQVEQNRMNAMPDGYTFRSNTRREADYKITEQVPSTMKTEGQVCMTSPQLCALRIRQLQPLCSGYVVE